MNVAGFNLVARTYNANIFAIQGMMNEQVRVSTTNLLYFYEGVNL